MTICLLDSGGERWLVSRWRVWTALDCVWTDARQPVSTLRWTTSPSTEETGSEEDQSGGNHSLWRRLHRWQLQTLVEVKFSLVRHRHRLGQSGSGGRGSWSADWLVQLRTYHVTMSKLHLYQLKSSAHLWSCSFTIDHSCHGIKWLSVKCLLKPSIEMTVLGRPCQRNVYMNIYAHMCNV